MEDFYNVRETFTMRLWLSFLYYLKTGAVS